MYYAFSEIQEYLPVSLYIFLDNLIVGTDYLKHQEIEWQLSLLAGVIKTRITYSNEIIRDTKYNTHDPSIPDRSESKVRQMERSISSMNNFESID